MSYIAQIRRTRCLGALTFGNPKSVVPLQAADLVCYESYKHMEMLGQPQYQLRPVLAKLQDQLASESGFFDAESIRRLSASRLLR